MRIKIFVIKTRPAGGSSRTVNIKDPGDLRFAHERRCNSEKIATSGVPP